MSRRGRLKRTCDCGCGRRVYQNKLVQVTVDQAIDQTLRVSKTTKRFFVTADCAEPFEEELGMMVLLEQLIRAWTPDPRSRWWLVNAWLNPLYPWPKNIYRWWRRVGAARRVMRLQHAIYERNKGFAYARARALQSAIMFGAPRFVQGFLARRLTGRLKKIEAELGCRHVNTEVRNGNILTCEDCGTPIGSASLPPPVVAG
jgi:hypothetical protein